MGNERGGAGRTGNLIPLPTDAGDESDPDNPDDQADPFAAVKSTIRRLRGRTGLGPVNTYLSASKMSTKWMKPMNITSSFSNRENIRR